MPATKWQPRSEFSVALVLILILFSWVRILTDGRATTTYDPTTYETGLS
jgi:hypothetical protein